MGVMRPMSLSSFNGIPPSPYYPYGGGSPVVNMNGVPTNGRVPVDQGRSVDHPQIMVSSEAMMEQASDEVFGDEIEVNKLPDTFLSYSQKFWL